MCFGTFFKPRHSISKFDCIEKRLDQSTSSRHFEIGAADHPIFLPKHFTLAIRELIVFTTIPSSINLSAIITQILDSSPTRLHFIVPRSIFKRRRLSRRVCFDTVRARARACVCVYIHHALDTYLFYRNTLLNPFRARHNNALSCFTSSN